MVLADSVEPLHYPAIMFSSPLAPQAPSPTIIPLLPPYSDTHTHTRAPSPSIILLLPFLYPSLPSSPGYFSPCAPIHSCWFILWLPPCLLYCLCLSLALSVHFVVFSFQLSDPIPLKLLLFHFFMLSPPVIFTFIYKFALIYWLNCCDFLKETSLPKPTLQKNI